MASVTETARRIGRRGLVVLSVTATMAISGVAFASWTLSGAGDGAADAAVAETLTPVSVSVAGQLYPGLTTDGILSVENPNDFPVLVTAVTFTGSVEVFDADGDPAVGCDDTDSAVTFTTATGLTFEIPANTTETETLPNAVAMGTGAINACQGMTFKQPFTLTATVG
ncbi:MAG: hypothetical protein WD360_05250 [Nitriliruptoraceae bacterium]